MNRNKRHKKLLTGMLFLRTLWYELDGEGSDRTIKGKRIDKLMHHPESLKWNPRNMGLGCGQHHAP